MNMYEKIKEKYGALKPMTVNLEVAKTMDRKSQTRRIAKDITAIATKSLGQNATGDTPSFAMAEKGQKLLVTNILDKSHWGWKHGYRYSCQDVRKRHREFYVEEDEIKLSGIWKVGDVLWVREPAKIEAFEVSKDVFEISYADDNFTKRYDFEMPQKHIKKSWTKKRGRVPNGCIKEMAHTFLKVTNVRVERLQDISDDDCLKEGIEKITTDCIYFKFGSDLCATEKDAYMQLWNSTAPKGYRWEDDPYVFVYDLEKIEV